MVPGFGFGFGFGPERKGDVTQPIFYTHAMLTSL